MYRVDLSNRNDIIIEYHSTDVGLYSSQHRTEKFRDIEKNLQWRIKKELKQCLPDIGKKITSLFSTEYIRSIHIVFRGDTDIILSPYIYGYFCNIDIPYDTCIIMHIDNQKLMNILYAIDEAVLDIDHRFISIDDSRHFDFYMRDGTVRNYELSIAGVGCNRELDIDNYY